MIALLTLALLGPAVSTATPPSDPFLEQYAKTRRFLAGRPVGPQATPDGRTVLFLRSAEDSPVQSLHAFDVQSGETRELLTRRDAARRQRARPERRGEGALERQRISARGFTSFQLSKDGSAGSWSALSGSLYVVDRASGASTKLKAGPAPFNPQFSPDGTSRGLRARLRRAGDRPAHQPRAAHHQRRHRAEDARARRVRRPGGDGPPQRVLVVSPDSTTIAFAGGRQHAAWSVCSIGGPAPARAGARRASPIRAPGKENAVVRLGVIAGAGRHAHLG